MSSDSLFLELTPSHCGLTGRRWQGSLYVYQCLLIPFIRVEPSPVSRRVLVPNLWRGATFRPQRASVSCFRMNMGRGSCQLFHLIPVRRYGCQFTIFCLDWRISCQSSGYPHSSKGGIPTTAMPASPGLWCHNS